MSIECKSCGATIDASASACPYCQANVAIPPPIPAPAANGSASTKPKGSIGVLVVLLILFWPGALIYYLVRSWK
jgi:hypothetical protein